MTSTSPQDLLLDYRMSISWRDSTPVHHPAIEAILRSPQALTGLFMAMSPIEPPSVLDVLVMAAHPTLFALTPANVTGQPGSYAQVLQLMAIWHKLSLSPGSTPALPWLDGALTRALQQFCSSPNNMIQAYIVYPLSSVLLAIDILAAIATRARHVPSPEMELCLTHLADRVASLTSSAANTPLLLRTASILSRLGRLLPEHRDRIRALSPASLVNINPFLYGVPPIRATIDDAYVLWLHADYPSLDAAIRNFMSQSPYSNFLAAPLLSPSHRLELLLDPTMEACLETLLCLPLYAPDQFASITADQWSDALHRSPASIKSRLIPMVTPNLAHASH